LKPSGGEYEKEVRFRIYEVLNTNPRIPHMTLERLKEKNPGLYDKLNSENGA